MKQKLSLLVLCLLLLGQPVFAYEPIQLSAEGIVLIEPKTNTILLSKNADQKFYPASITKILTAYILIQDMDPNKVVTKSQNSIETVPADSSHIGVAVGDSYSYKAGLYGLLLGSDNFIAHDMARLKAGSIASFAEKMNVTAKLMGAKNTHFVNPHGYHDPNHYTTPYDMGQIARNCFANETLRTIAGTTNYEFKVKNTNKVISIKNSAQVIRSSSPYFNPNIVCVKTGYHSSAQQTIVAMAEYDNISLIAVVMKTHRPNQYADLNKLFEYGAKNYSVVKHSDGTYKLINQTASAWAKPYMEGALKGGWIQQGAVNYQQPMPLGELKDMLGKALNPEQITKVGSRINTLKGSGSITRSEFANLIECLSEEQAEKLRIHEPHKSMTYEEGVCIVSRLII